MTSSPRLPDNVRLHRGIVADHADYPAADSVMRALAVAEDRHFWHASRNAFIVGRLRRLGFGQGTRTLDIGCGAGCVSAALERAGHRVTGIDGHLSRVLLASERAPGSRFIVHDLTRGLDPVGEDTFDVALLLDVIEHLDDPVAALTSALARVREGGVLAGTVPALMALWSQIDVLSGHKRRYSVQFLSKTLAAVPGRPLELVPFFRHLVPLMLLQRKLMLKNSARMAEENLDVPGLGINGLLRSAGTLERWLAPALDRLPLPGASLWFALRK